MLFPEYKGPWSVSFFSFIVRATSVHIPIWESCYPKLFLLIVYKNITKNNNLLSLIAIQNKNIKTNIWHPLQRNNITLIFLSFLKTNIYYKIWGQSWLYGSWIYNYLCNQWTSPLMLWVRIRLDEVYLIQHYVIKFVSDLRQVSDFLWVLWFPEPIKLTAMI
jgi:hypothetical protein